MQEIVKNGTHIFRNNQAIIDSIDVIRNAANVGFFDANPPAPPNFYHYSFIDTICHNKLVNLLHLILKLIYTTD
jgi:hypothetical protein